MSGSFGLNFEQMTYYEEQEIRWQRMGLSPVGSQQLQSRERRQEPGPGRCPRTGQGVKNMGCQFGLESVFKKCEGAIIYVSCWENESKLVFLKKNICSSTS